ncbi:hydantoinase B/oxoprolinase family protein [Mesorhizobium sp. WSM4976]|uniref:hydantoinase B/oxoprolinase family protein n=1 Tax=Mesorhizobium sp. WSM4976 TaxID=3038549 RepID=UPI0024176FEB|nr:hydantoinase B/oxoprolinase family protein [Mesorhizobium sp. WSM4976]MDG4898387.1 hydantoinase B/oxoprolinase family protein [Mesorhizobium sp. WSM4976]
MDTATEKDQARTRAFDPLLLSVLANRFDNICREMTNTLLRAGRSTVISVARDFSCSLVTADNRLLAAPESLPVHVFGSHLVTESMVRLHPVLEPGDAFLHNDPYDGNTHAADHTIIVPVIVDGVHLFSACAKAHQADCGNSLPTTYMPNARDVYEEGALIFPCVRIQQNYRDVDDIIRMCRSRIRAPEQWYGDYLAALGAARIGERGLLALVNKYGMETVKIFIEEWFDYSERRVADAISRLPTGRIVGHGKHDSTPALPDGVPIKVVVDIDAEAGRVVVDLRDNIDCVPAGLNQSAACAFNNAMTGVLNALSEDLPCNAGTFRRMKVLLRENCVVGIPKFPHSTSMATTNLADRLVSITHAAIADFADGHGLAEGGMSTGPGIAVISGHDDRRAGAEYVNELVLQSNGGPGSPFADGWLNYGTPVIAGMMYRDSVELDEQKYPILIRSLRILRDSAGAGTFRGAPGQEVIYGPRFGSMTVIYTIDGHSTPPRGVRGGRPASLASAERITVDGRRVPLPSVSLEVIWPGEWIVGTTNGGGGYGSPLERDPERVFADVVDGWVSPEAALEVYGVVLTESDGILALDTEATSERRAARRTVQTTDEVGNMPDETDHVVRN